ncbi:MAG: hypothetical protein ACI9FD_004210, partial [Gammaproteobacteria bacterium]
MSASRKTNPTENSVAIAQRTKRHLRACMVTGLIASGVGLGYVRIIGGT